MAGDGAGAGVVVVVVCATTGAGRAATVDVVVAGAVGVRAATREVGEEVEPCVAWPAALAGFLLAVLNLGLLLFFIRHVVDLSALQVARWVELTALVIIVPFAAVIAASLSARLSVLRLLRSFP